MAMQILQPLLWQKKGTLVRCDGLKATDLMDAILSLMPLDEFVEKPVFIMDKEPRRCGA